MLTELSTTPTNDESRRFCSAQAKSLGADPLGTAPMYDEFLMIEFDLPWTRNVVDSPGFPEAVAQAVTEAKEQGRRVVVLAFAPDPRHSVAGSRRIMYFSRSEQRINSKERMDSEQHVESEQPTVDDGAQRVSDFFAAEYVVPLEQVAPLTRFVLFGEGDAGEWTSHRVDRSRLAAGDGALGTVADVASSPDVASGLSGHSGSAIRAAAQGVRDLFVCTHGARDACCGKYGAALQLELDAMVSAGTASKSTPLRVWRVSHLGGHRFAPTLLDLPSGRYWGAVDSAALPALVEGPERAQFGALRRCYRGWTGLDSAAQQVAEAEAWQRLGTDWLRYDKWVWTVASETDPELTNVAIEWKDPVTGADGRRGEGHRAEGRRAEGHRAEGRIEVDVAVGRVITLQESCGKDFIESKQWIVTRYDEA